MPNFLKYLFYALVGLGAVLLFLLFYLGVSCILTTVLFYAILFLVFRGAVRLFVRKNKSLQRNILLALTVVIGTLLGCEFLLRYVIKTDLNYNEENNHFFSFSDRTKYIDYLVRKYIDKEPDQWVRVNKNVTHEHGNHEFSYPHHFNSIGFRDKEPPIDTNEVVIVGLGDSFTEGVGTPQDSTYTELLQTILKQKAAPYRVLNAGEAGSDVFGEFMILRQCFIKYHPKLVLLLLNSSDISEVTGRGGMERFRPDGRIGFPPRPWWAPMTEVSLIFRIYVHRVLKYSWNFVQEKEVEQRKTDAQKKIVDCIANDIQSLATKNNCRLIVLYQPVQHELELEDELSTIKKMMTAHPEVSTLDLYPVMKKDMAAGVIKLDKIYWPVDRHFNSTGYAYLAHTIYSQLQPVFDTLDKKFALKD